MKKSAGVCGNMGAWWTVVWRWSPDCMCSPKLKPAPTAGLTTNADMGPTQVRDHCPVDETGRQLLGAAMRQMSLSARVSSRAEARANDRGPGGE